MNKKQVIRINERQLKQIVAESVKKVLKETGETKRGNYMLGRALRRASERGDYHTTHDIWDRQNDKYNDAWTKGYEDQEKLDAVNHDRSLQSSPRRNVKFNYDVYKMEDMEELGKKFINFIEKHNGGSLIQTIVDYESGNQTGKKESPLKELIPYFEEEVLGYDCTDEMIDAITKAYNHWWFYAEDQLMPYDY